jgi:arginyl-tRNA synthetase
MAFAGYDVTREYYINDGGAQVDTLARSVYLRYLEALGEAVAFEEGSYPGDYLIGRRGAGRRGRRALGRSARGGLAARDPGVRHRCDDGADPRGSGRARRPRWMSSFREIALRHRPDRGRDRAAGRRPGPDLRGVLEPPKGKTPEDWEPREQTPVPIHRVATTSTGRSGNPMAAGPISPPTSPITSTRSSAASTQLIDIFGADHGGYVKRMKAAVSALSDGRCRSTSS